MFYVRKYFSDAIFYYNFEKPLKLSNDISVEGDGVIVLKRFCCDL